jgi:arsenite-transporting ATPase
VLEAARETFGSVGLRECPQSVTEPVGPDALADLAERLYADGAPGSDPLDVVAVPPAMEVERSGDDLVLVLRLPLAERGGIDLARRGDDLVVSVGSSRRVLTLPSALRRCRVVGASLRAGLLRVRFEPDPDLWRPL